MCEDGLVLQRRGNDLVNEPAETLMHGTEGEPPDIETEPINEAEPEECSREPETSALLNWKTEKSAPSEAGNVAQPERGKCFEDFTLFLNGT